MTLDEFVKDNELTLIEVPPDLWRVEIRDGSIRMMHGVRPTTHHAATLQLARKSLFEQLRGKTLVIGAYTLNRCEIKVPADLEP